MSAEDGMMVQSYGSSDAHILKGITTKADRNVSHVSHSRCLSRKISVYFVYFSMCLGNKVDI